MEKNQQPDKSSETKEQTPFERFEGLLKKVVSVPKEEAERIVRAVPSPAKKKRRGRKG